MMWFQVFEAWAVNRLLASPLFHRMVRGVHRKINHLRYGPPPEDMGGTKIDVNSGPGYFLRLFKEEIKQQLKDNPSKRR